MDGLIQNDGLKLASGLLHLLPPEHRCVLVRSKRRPGGLGQVRCGSYNAVFSCASTVLIACFSCRSFADEADGAIACGICRNLGDYTSDDVWQIRLNSDGNIEFVRNGDIVGTSEVRPTLPLFMDVAMSGYVADGNGLLNVQYIQSCDISSSGVEVFNNLEQCHVDHTISDDVR